MRRTLWAAGVVVCAAGIARADEAGPASDLAAATDAAVAGEAEEDGTEFEVTLGWQTGSVTDYWYRDTDSDGDHTPSSHFAVEMEHPFAEGWALWAQVDAWFDSHDWKWSSSQTDSIAFVAAVRRDLGHDFELEVGARYDDWLELHGSGGDPWGPYAMVSCTVEALGGELSPYFYQEMRKFIDGDSGDGSWITELGAEYERPLGDCWTLALSGFGARIDGSRTDPDVWALDGRCGVEVAIDAATTLGVFVEATFSTGGSIPSRTATFAGVELKFLFGGD
jgi:hypothetical protein